MQQSGRARCSIRADWTGQHLVAHPTRDIGCAVTFGNTLFNIYFSFEPTKISMLLRIVMGLCIYITALSSIVQGDMSYFHS